jgi:hypothetical protein
VLLIQGRQKGWHVGQDVRQGRGSSSLLHEVVAQYMMWTKVPGSRLVDGRVSVVATKDRYGHRPEGSAAATWLYGPSGFALVAPEPPPAVLEPEQVEAAWTAYLDGDPRDPDLALPPKEAHAVEAVMGVLGTKDRGSVEAALHRLVKYKRVKREKLTQPGKAGVRPWRVWTVEEPTL